MTGWLLAFAVAVDAARLRRRLELVARAEHELRGPLAAFALGLEAARRGRPVAGALDAELERARCALADLTAARRGGRASPAPRPIALERLVRSSAAAWGARLDWRAGAVRLDADAGRIAQALGNLLSNAAEHGEGEVVVRATRGPAPAAAHPCGLAAAADPCGVRIEVGNADRGRGLSIAAAAAHDAGGRLALARGEDGSVRATLDLPLAG